MVECLDLFLLVPTYPTCLTYALEWVTGKWGGVGGGGGGGGSRFGTATQSVCVPACAYLVVSGTRVLMGCADYAK